MAPQTAQMALMSQYNVTYVQMDSVRTMDNVSVKRLDPPVIVLVLTMMDNIDVIMIK